MKLAVGCDEAAYDLKNTIVHHLKEKGVPVEDLGTYNTEPVLYPDIAVKVAEKIISGECDRGILICGTGIGMSITANKIPGIRAAVCHDVYSTQRSRKSNDTQVMCLGSRVIAPELAICLVDEWLKCDFDKGRSVEKVEKIMYYEQKYKAGGLQCKES